MSQLMKEGGKRRPCRRSRTAPLPLLRYGDVTVHGNAIRLRKLLRPVFFLLQSIQRPGMGPEVIRLPLGIGDVGFRWVKACHHEAESKLTCLDHAVLICIVACKVHIFRRLLQSLLHHKEEIGLFQIRGGTPLLVGPFRDNVHDPVIYLIRSIGISVQAIGGGLRSRNKGELSKGHIQIVLGQGILLYENVGAPVEGIHIMHTLGPVLRLPVKSHHDDQKRQRGLGLLPDLRRHKQGIIFPHFLLLRFPLFQQFKGHRFFGGHGEAVSSLPFSPGFSRNRKNRKCGHEEKSPQDQQEQAGPEGDILIHPNQNQSHRQSILSYAPVIQKASFRGTEDASRYSSCTGAPQESSPPIPISSAAIRIQVWVTSGSSRSFAASSSS